MYPPPSALTVRGKTHARVYRAGAQSVQLGTWPPSVGPVAQSRASQSPPKNPITSLASSLLPDPPVAKPSSFLPFASSALYLRCLLLFFFGENSSGRSLEICAGSSPSTPLFNNRPTPPACAHRPPRPTRVRSGCLLTAIRDAELLTQPPTSVHGDLPSHVDRAPWQIVVVFSLSTECSSLPRPTPARLLSTAFPLISRDRLAFARSKAGATVNGSLLYALVAS